MLKIASNRKIDVSGPTEIPYYLLLGSSGQMNVSAKI